MTAILFWSRGEEHYRFLSNFYSAPITYKGQVWPTLEHLYHAGKYTEASVREQIRSLRTPQETKSFRHDSYTPEFGERKLAWMKFLTRLKYEQHPELAEKLLATGECELVHYAPWGDTYWGVDKELKGQNVQGKLLMEVRVRLQTMR